MRFRMQKKKRRGRRASMYTRAASLKRINKANNHSNNSSNNYSGSKNNKTLRFINKKKREQYRVYLMMMTSISGAGK